MEVRLLDGRSGGALGETARIAFEGGQSFEVLTDDGQWSGHPPGAGPWTVRVTGEEHWSPAWTGETLSGAVVELPVVPRGVIAFVLEEGSPAEAVRVRGSPAFDATGTATASAAAAVVGEGFEDACEREGRTVRCAVPAGLRLDYRIRMAGHVSRYLWGSTVEPGGVLDLGSMAFEPGASVVGWLTGEQVLSRTVLRLTPETSGTPDVGAVTRGGVRAQTARPSVSGFYHFRGVPEGIYRLEVTHPDAAPVVRRPVRIVGTAEHGLGPIHLVRATEAVVELDPPSAPGGTAWALRVTSAESSFGAPQELEFVPDVARPGRFSATGVAPGLYRVQVYREGSRAPWGLELLDVGEGGGSLRVEMDLVEVEGELRIGGKGAPGRLWFGGRSAIPRIGVRVTPTGRFETVLPRRERWRIEVESPRVGRLQVEVPVGETTRPGVGRVEIELPATEIGGSVRLADGKPLVPAEVHVTAVGTGDRVYRERLRVEADGRYRLRGLAEDRYTLRAEHRARGGGEYQSEGVEIDIDEGSSPVELGLLLEAHQQVAGRVVGPEGLPIAGAWLRGRALAEGGVGLPAGVRGVSDHDGRMEVWAPPETTGLAASVWAAGFAGGAHRVVLGESGFEVRLEREGGTLVLTDLVPWRQPGDPVAEVRYEGQQVFLGDLWRWAGVHGDTAASHRRELVLPDMRTGSYSLCLQGKSHCEEGVLVRGGELVLRFRPDGG